jgi:DNA-binding MarR family transcriptional regulator
MLSTPERAEVTAFSAAVDEFLRAQRRVRGRFNGAPGQPELSLSQFHLLEPLAGADEPVGVGALADVVGVSAPSATRMLGALGRRGLVERRADPGDRRVVRVALTAHGRELVAAKGAQIRAARTVIFDSLSVGEQRSAARVLQSLAAAIDELHP